METKEHTCIYIYIYVEIQRDMRNLSLSAIPWPTSLPRSPEPGDAKNAKNAKYAKKTRKPKLFQYIANQNAKKQ